MVKVESAAVTPLLVGSFASDSYVAVSLIEYSHIPKSLTMKLEFCLI